VLPKDWLRQIPLATAIQQAAVASESVEIVDSAKIVVQLGAGDEVPAVMVA